MNHSKAPMPIWYARFYRKHNSANAYLTRAFFCITPYFNGAADFCKEVLCFFSILYLLVKEPCDCLNQLFSLLDFSNETRFIQLSLFVTCYRHMICEGCAAVWTFVESAENQSLRVIF